jgi:hypothetical protein
LMKRGSIGLYVDLGQKVMYLLRRQSGQRHLSVYVETGKVMTTRQLEYQ